MACIIVRQDDTLWRIAERLTGDGRNWQRLYEDSIRAANVGIGEHITDPHRIRPGQRIAVHLSKEGSGAIDYHVSRGESLWLIADRIYGDPMQWRRIHRENAISVADPDLIYPGQVILLTLEPYP
jgi:nucleoid-associated protein YgaU